jgi:ribonuclease P protein component
VAVGLLPRVARVAASGSPPETTPPARPARLKRRAEFVAAARGRRTGTAAFLLQASPRSDPSPRSGVGFTATRKLGGAVVRNRARRRLRAAIDSLPQVVFAPGWNYVVVARGAALTCPFRQLRSDLEASIRRLTPVGVAPSSSSSAP